MTYPTTDDNRRDARERVAARQARHNQNAKQTATNSFVDKLSSSLRSGTESLTSRVANRTNRKNDTSIEEDFANKSYEEMYDLDDSFASNIVERETPKVDPYADIPRNYNQRPVYNRDDGRPVTHRPVQIQGQNEIMRPSQGQTSVRIPLISQDRIGSNQLSFSGNNSRLKMIIAGVVIAVLVVAIIFGIVGCVSS